jgi:hypothetical protein
MNKTDEREISKPRWPVASTPDEPATVIIESINNPEWSFSPEELRSLSFKELKKYIKWEKINRGYIYGVYNDQNKQRLRELSHLTEICATHIELNHRQRAKLKAQILPYSWRGHNLYVVILAMAMLIIHDDFKAGRSIRKAHPNNKPLDEDVARMITDLASTQSVGTPEVKYDKALSAVRKKFDKFASGYRPKRRQ